MPSILPVAAVLGASVAAISILSKQANEFSDAISKTSSSQSSYSETASELNNLNSELATSAQRISELQALKNAGTISFTEQSELETLKLQNEELERQISLKQQMADTQSETTVNDALNALKLQRTTDFTQEVLSPAEDGERYFSGYAETDIISATKNEINELSDLQTERSVLLNKLNSTSDKSEKDMLTKKLNVFDLKISDRFNAVSDNIKILNGLRESFKDPLTGLMKTDMSAEAEMYYSSITKIIDDFNSQNLSPTERSSKNLDKFFDDSYSKNVIKDTLIEAAKSGENLNIILKNMGLSFDDLGVENIKDLKTYLNTLVSDADAASDSIKSLSDTESINSVASAFHSKNSGYNYEQAIVYSQRAADLFNQGLVGTDDFKAFADYISYGMDDSIEAYQAGMEKFNRYFTAENDTGLQNFIQDFKEMHSLGEDDDWISNIGNTAQLAKDMGIGIGAVEDILSRMEDYGYITSDQWHSSLNDLNTYKTSLSNIKDIYDKMNAGTDKDRLGRLISGWDEAYAGFETDLSALSEEQIVRIQFAYDLSNIQLEIDFLKEKLNGGLEGSAANEAYSEIIAKNNQYIATSKSELNLDEIKLPVQFQNLEEEIALAKKQMDEASEEEKIEFQESLSNKQELEKALLNDFADQNPTITPDTDPSLVQEALNNYFSQPQSLIIDAELNSDDVENQLNRMAKGSSITYTADVNGIERRVQAIKNEDGTISYTADINGVTIPAEKKEENGVVSYSVNTKDVFAFTPPGKDGVASYTDDCSGISKTAPTIYGTAIYTAANIASNIVGAFFGGHVTGTLLSPAHADGKVSLPQNETALVNELGTESIIRNGKWMLIPGGMHREHLKKGDIILNANQTKSLMKYGKAAGKGRAYAEGTLTSVLSNAYAGGSGDAPEPETFDWIENRIKHLESLTEDWKNKLESVTTFKAQNSYISQVISAIQNEISNLNASYNAYMAKAASLGLGSDYVEKIQSGQLVIEDITDEDLQEKIKEYQDWYDKAEDCRKSIEDLKLDIKDLNEEQVDNITNDFGNLSSLFKTIIGHYETLNELAEKQGKSLGRSDYDALIKYNNELKAVKSEELKNIQAEFDRLMKTQEDFAGSDLYMDMQEHIFSLKDDIASINIELEDIKDTIVESDFSAFKKNESHLKSFADELDRVGDLLNENNFFNDNGSFTASGLTKIALISEQMATARQLMAEYENAIDQLGKHLSKGNISQEEYNESLEEYREGAQNAAADVKRYKEAILDLVKDGLKQELDTNKELISARKEALKGLKDYDNYQKKIEDKNKDIQQLQAQLAALEGQTGQNVDRQRRELQAKLKELEADKQELMDDRAYDLRMEGYDKAQDNLEERFDAYIKDLESNTETQEKVISDTLKNVRDNYGSVAGELNKIGVNMSEDIAGPWLSAKNAAKQYTDAMKDAAAKSTIVTDKIDTSKREDASVIQSIAPKPAEKGHEPPTDQTHQPDGPSGPKSPNDLGLDPSPSTKGLSWLAKEVSIHDRLLYNGWAASDRNYQLLHEWAGGQGSWTGAAEQNIHILNALKSAGFSHGGILESTGEDGIFLGRNKEAVLTETQWNTIRNLADAAPVLVHPLPQFSAPQNPDTVTNVFDAPLIQVEGKADEYTVRELRQLARSIAPMIGKEFYKDARKIGLK